MIVCLAWRTIRVHLALLLARPLTFAVLGLLVLWVIAVPGVGVHKGDFATRERELGYPPISDARLAGLAAAQVASGMMTLGGVVLLLDNLERERENNVGEVLASLPVPGWGWVVLQYLSNLSAVLALSVLAYVVALIAYPFRQLDVLALSDFLWPGILLPLGSAFLLASLPLFLDALGFQHIKRGLAYGVVAVLCNLGPYALAVATNLDHPLHPWVQIWSTAHLGLDTFGVWYVRGYLELLLRVVEQLGTPEIPALLVWRVIVRPRLMSAALGLILVTFSAWRFDRFQIAAEH